MKKAIYIILMILLPLSAYANKTSVTIDAPESAKKGDLITVVISVSHKGNNFMHHTNLVELSINGEEVKKWEYSAGNLPEDNDFKLTYQFKLEKESIIKSFGSCNIHGSAGEVQKVVKINSK